MPTTLRLAVPMLDAVRLTVTGNLSAALTKIDSLKAEKKAATSGFNAELKELDALVHSLNSSLITGTVEEEVEVEEKTDLFRGVVVTVRLDTGAAVKERPLDPEERQMSLGEASVPGNVMEMDAERARRAEEQNAAATPEEAEALRDQRLAQEAAERGEAAPPELPQPGDLIEVRSTEDAPWVEAQVTLRTEMSFQAAVDIGDAEGAPTFDVEAYGKSWRWPLDQATWDDVQAESDERQRERDRDREIEQLAAQQALDAGPKTLLRKPNGTTAKKAAEPAAGKKKSSPKKPTRLSAHDEDGEAMPPDDGNLVF